ncbi:MAG: hypothetical protein KIS90_03960 [Phenylobacterium sp.]|nr:hypothetical protein [Phenylobacterium sp.]
MVDMIVTARVCRYDRHEYRRGERIEGVAPNHAAVLRVTGKAADAPPRVVGHVASTQPLPPEDPEPRSVEPAAAPSPPAPRPGAPERLSRDPPRRRRVDNARVIRSEDAD